MAQATARIRRYAPEDEKLVLFMAGKANMELLAQANFKTYFNPFVVGIWLGLSSLLVGYMGMWPDVAKHGMASYLSPLPIFAALAVPIMFGVDWVNRPQVEAHTQDVLRNHDIHDVANYYSKSAASGFWVLEYGKTFVGLVSLDANQESKKERKQLKKTAQAGDGDSPQPKTAVIRHFYVVESYRKTLIQDDLIKHAVGFAFDHDPALERVVASDCTLVPYIGECLSRAGFVREGPSETIGVMKWKIYTTRLLRANWKP